jgi:hypothetical protein
MVVLASLVAAACGEEGPTAVGAGLLPTDAVRTFEIVLEPHQYMVWDTAFGLYSEPRDMQFAIVAQQFEGALNSHVLARFTIPTSLSVPDTLGIMRLDTMPIYTGGTLRLLVDTARSTAPPVRLALYRTAQEWDASATWQHRIDTTGVQLPWTTPGGTRGPLVDTASYALEADTVVFRIDSATIAAWRDGADVTRGALITSQTADSRLRVGIPVLHLDARSTHNPDTVFNVSGSPTRRTFIFEPAQPVVSSTPRVGGTPAWRTILRLQERLDTLSFACPGVPNCTFRLSEATINNAGLRLQPVPPPPGMRPEADVVIGAYTIEPTALVPLQRSPLGNLIGVVTVPHTSFLAPAAPIAEISITELIRAAVLPPERRGDVAVPTHIALVPGFDPRLFGFGTFASLPRLRLVVSIAQELQLP